MADILPCEGKIFYTSMKSAIDASRIKSRVHGQAQTAYHCRYCKQYHLTTQKSKKSKRFKWRKK